MAMSNYLENKIIDHVCGTASFTAPATVYLALFTTDPTDAGSGTEVSGGSYERKPITFAAAASGTTSNDADVSFPQATANWGTVTHYGVFDASTAGNLLFHGSLTTSKLIETADMLKVLTGNLTLTAS